MTCGNIFAEWNTQGNISHYIIDLDTLILYIWKQILFIPGTPDKQETDPMPGINDRGRDYSAQSDNAAAPHIPCFLQFQVLAISADGEQPQ